MTMWSERGSIALPKDPDFAGLGPGMSCQYANAHLAALNIMVGVS